ncbi:MAG TPA: hypothetical protein ACFCUC_06755, partial [Desulfobacterales bacterium]
KTSYGFNPLNKNSGFGRFETIDRSHRGRSIVEVAADTRKKSLRDSTLCATASDAVDAVRSASPQGFQIFQNIVWIQSAE